MQLVLSHMHRKTFDKLYQILGNPLSVTVVRVRYYKEFAQN